MKKPWVVLAAICATMLFQGAQIGGIQVLLADIGQEFGLDVSQSGQLASLQYICVIAAPLAVGGLADRFGKGKDGDAGIFSRLRHCILSAIGSGAGYSTSSSRRWIRRTYGGILHMAGAALPWKGRALSESDAVCLRARGISESAVHSGDALTMARPFSIGSDGDAFVSAPTVSIS